MEAANNLPETLSDEWFRQVNGLLDGLQVEEQIVENVSDHPTGIYN